VVGAGGFEPPAFWSQTRRATKLRYAPFLVGVALSKTAPRLGSAVRANGGLYFRPPDLSSSTVRPLGRRPQGGFGGRAP
jgi:hypothetical protein